MVHEANLLVDQLTLPSIEHEPTHAFYEKEKDAFETKHGRIVKLRSDIKIRGSEIPVSQVPPCGAICRGKGSQAERLPSLHP